MRRVPSGVIRAVVLALVLACAALGAACTGGSGPARPTTPPADPAVVRACSAARKVILDSTNAVTTERDRATAAGEAGDAAARDAAVAAVRAVFKDWSARLRAEADKAADPKLKGVLTEYGGAVDAVATRVGTSPDLDELYTFDGSELDVAASRFREVCP